MRLALKPARRPRPTNSHEERPAPSATVVFLATFLSVAVLGGAMYTIYRFAPGLSPGAWLIALGAIVVYIAAGHFIHVHPDTSDLGLFGGLVDNPLSYTDDVNRFLLFLWVLLLPGRFIASSLIALGRLFFGGSR